MVVVRVALGGAGPDLRADRRQAAQVDAAPGRGDQDLLGRAPVLIRDRLGPLGQLQGLGLGDHPALGQGRVQDLVAAGQRLDRQVLGGLAPGDPQRVDQPGPGAALPAGQVPVLGIEDLQQPPPEGGSGRVGPFQGPELVRGGRGGQAGRVLGGQEHQRALLRAHRGLQHGQGLGAGGRNRRGAHVLAHLPRAGLDAVPDPTLTGGSDISGWPGSTFDYYFLEVLVGKRAGVTAGTQRARSAGSDCGPGPLRGGATTRVPGSGCPGSGSASSADIRAVEHARRPNRRAALTTAR